MATSTSSYFSNSLVGVPQVAGSVDIYANDSSPKYAVGAKYERADGAVFRYAHFGGTATQNYLVAGVPTEVQVAYAAARTATAPSSTYQMPDEPVGVYPGSIGSRYLIVAMTGSSNQYAGAYVSIVDGTGSGYTYRVRGNTAFGTPTTAQIRLNLYDQIVTAVDVTSVAIVAGSKWNDLANTSTATAACVPSGVSMISATSGTWGWVQTKGPCAVIADAATVPTVGKLLTTSATVGGCVTAWTTGTTAAVAPSTSGLYPIIGYTMNPTAASKYNIADLQLD